MTSRASPVMPSSALALTMKIGMTMSFRATARTAAPVGFKASAILSPAPTNTRPRLSEAVASMSIAVITGS